MAPEGTEGEKRLQDLDTMQLKLELIGI